MAEIFIRQLIDDLDGKPIDTGLGHEVTFSYQGADYRIDLRPTNADKIEAVFAPYIKAAEKVSSASKPRKKTSAAVKASGSGRSVEQLKAIREWAGNNGFDVSHVGGSKPTLSMLSTPHIEVCEQRIFSLTPNVCRTSIP
ncbi:histone-like nucleoid-structuring protein Lsr2 [Rhodococcus sp. 24CO]|uniref:histone-like nucleoid-structuring protein Lsr2 n=1 Tax=Rhodococcus sp. 24CO TaxID=3117460 RepID=UPI003D34D4B1